MSRFSIHMWLVGGRVIKHIITRPWVEHYLYMGSYFVLSALAGRKSCSYGGHHVPSIARHILKSAIVEGDIWKLYLVKTFRSSPMQKVLSILYFPPSSYVKKS